MARTKEFDPQRALNKAMNVFWSVGYQAASLERLMKEMGLSKQSVYDTFGDKRSLYLQALAYYRRKTNDGLRQLLSGAHPVKQAFRKLLFGLSSETREQHERGCLLLSANLERDTGDAEIAELLRQNQAEVESIFAEALRRAQKKGEIPRGQDPEALSRFFVVTIQGMRSMARLKSDRRALRQVAKVALAVFD
jgi:TetR/AcrR family transcriptional repressor of nem operon